MNNLMYHIHNLLKISGILFVIQVLIINAIISQLNINEKFIYITLNGDNCADLFASSIHIIYLVRGSVCKALEFNS